MRICGAKPQSVAIVNAEPDDVVSVMCQIMAYWTSDEPKSETVCPVRKRAMFLFQPERMKDMKNLPSLTNVAKACQTASGSLRGAGEIQSLNVR